MGFVREKETQTSWYVSRAGIMIMVKVQDGHDAGLRPLHRCIESGSK
jgi:hypothetical protein